jgi:hypothetical protein
MINKPVYKLLYQMSHFTYIKTRFQNLFYLKKALNELDINYREDKKLLENSQLKCYRTNIIIPQSNNYDVEFSWNGHEYELISDMYFWKQAYTFKSFIDKISQEYASELITGESQKIGFQPIKYQRNEDGSKTLVLERYTQVLQQI